MGLIKNTLDKNIMLLTKQKKFFFETDFCLFFANSLQGDPNGKRTHEELFI